MRYSAGVLSSDIDDIHRCENGCLNPEPNLLEVDMIMSSRRDLKIEQFRRCGFPGGLVLLLIFLMGIFASEVFYETQPALARSHLGILGQQAPELNLNNWISADGLQRAPIRISDFRGKVIYLYFFQDW